MSARAWKSVGDHGAAAIEITGDWASFAHWTPAQRAMKIEQDGERRQAQQVAESQGRLVARLVAEMVASEMGA
jgi:hypothetical protein